MNAERQAESKVATAWKLIHLRASLHTLHDIVTASKTLTDRQDRDRLHLIDAIAKAKKSLIKAGLSPALLANTDLLKHHLRTSARKQPGERFRSGGVGVFATGGPIKIWT